MAAGARDPETIHLLEIEAWTGSAVETLRVSTHTITTSPTDTPANTEYLGDIIDPGRFSRNIGKDGSTFGEGDVDVGSIEINNRDGRNDAWIGYGYGRTAVLKVIIGRDAPVSSATVVARFTVLGVETPNALSALRLRLRSRLADLDRPLLATRYVGTTLTTGATAEGDEQIEGKIKPYAFGSCPNVEGVLVNRFDLLYQFAANPSGVSSLVVYDGGIALTPTADYPVLSSLLAATVEAGEYATCLALGIARLGGPPAFVVTADVVEGATLALRSPARIMERMLDLMPTVAAPDIDDDTFDDFHSFFSGEAGIVIDSDESALSAIGRVAASGRGAIVTSAAGLFQAVWNAGPAVTSEATLTFRELIDGSGLQLFAGPTQEGDGVPVWRVVVNHSRVWRVMSTGDMAQRIASATEGADLARKQYLMQQTRQVVAEDATVKTAYPLAGEMTIDTVLTSATDAAALASALLALFKVRRDRISFPTFDSDGTSDLGATVTVQLTNRLGFNAGKRMLVIGREDNRRRKVNTLTLWG